MNRLWIALGCWACCVPLGAQDPSAAEIRQFARLPAGLTAIEQGPRQVPVTAQADVVVAGGGVSGVTAALKAASAGLSVILVEERNCLGHEATTAWALQSQGGTLPDELAQSKKLLGELRRAIGRDGCVDPTGCQAALHRLVAAQAQIRVFFFSLPVGVVVDQGQVRGLVVVNHAGRQVFLAQAVVDATEDGRIGAAAQGEHPRKAKGELSFRRALAADSLPAGKLPDTLPALHDAVECGVAKEGRNVVLTCRVPNSGDAALDWSRAQAATLRQAVVLRNRLGGKPAEAKTSAISPEILALPQPAAKPAGASGSPGVKCLIVVERPTDAQSASLETALVHGEIAAQAACQAAKQAGGFRTTHARRAEPASSTGPQVREMLAGPTPGAAYPVLVQSAASLPVGGKFDVVVVGGGTSGAVSAIAAARQGAKVALLEVLPNLGGTSSNRVNCYYWGVPWKSALSEEIDLPIQTKRNGGETGLEKVRFSGEEKKVSLQDLALKAGVRIFYRSFGAGAVTDGNRVTGVVVENASGRHVLLAKTVVDATGHADIAAAAGAAYDLGRPRDGFLHEAEHGPLRDALDAEDMSKFYLRSPQSALSLNIRESRRLRGDYTVTFDDVLHQRRFPDVIARWRSNYDTHFPHSAGEEDVAQDWAGILGLFRKPLLGRIPYRAILPHGLDGILVVGKSYSATHDALIGGRMQRDLQHLGEAAGVAAAMACRKKLTPRNLPVGELQVELVRLGVLQAEELADAQIAALDKPTIDTAATAARLGSADALNAMVDLYLAGPASVDALLPLLQSDDTARRTEAALVLGMLGRREAVDTLLERLQARDARTFTFLLPNGSGRPSVPVYCSAVILLGRLRVAEAAAPIRELLSDRQKCPPDVASFAIVALGRIGDKTAVDVIRPYLQVSKSVGLRDENMQSESHWGVRTNAARTLAQLGDKSGVPVLIELLDADQARLRSYAQRLLEEIAGRSFGADRAAWQKWWESK